jgi:hypothetical protein
MTRDAKRQVKKAKQARSTAIRKEQKDTADTLKASMEASRAALKASRAKLKQGAEYLRLLTSVAPQQNREGVFCYCKGKRETRKDQTMLCCADEDTCPGRGWYHALCVGMTPRQAEAATDWRCQPCQLIFMAKEAQLSESFVFNECEWMDFVTGTASSLRGRKEDINLSEPEESEDMEGAFDRLMEEHGF